MKVPACLAALLLPVFAASVLRAENTDRLLEELTLPRPVVADADNGWPEARKLISTRPVDGKGKKREFLIFPGEGRSGQVPGVDEEVLLECRRLNGPALDTMRKILALPAWQRPHPVGVWPAELLEPGSYNLGFPIRVVMAEAVVQAKQGHLDKAWPDILTTFQLGRRVAESGGTQMETLYASALTGTASSTAAFIAQFARDPAALRTMAASLEPLESCGDIYRRTLDGELYWMLKRIELYQSDPDFLKRTLVEQHLLVEQASAMKAEFDAWANSNLKLLGKKDAPLPDFRIAKYPYDENRAKWLKDPPEEVLQELEVARGTDWTAETQEAVKKHRSAILIQSTTWADFRKPDPLKEREAAGELEGYHELALNVTFRIACSVRQARLCLLVRAWMLEHAGTRPETLRDLVPGYLKAIPADPFDGQPMRYNKDRIWSVDKDLEDNGGNNEKDRVLLLP